MVVEWHIDSNVRSEVFHCPPSSVAITAMAMARLEAKWHLFVGTDDGIVHVFEKKYHYKMACSIAGQHAFDEPILEMAANDAGSRLMVADCGTMKLFDIQRLHEEARDYLLMREWRPHCGCITALLHVPGFDVFCSASDNGELVLWDLEGLRIGQFGRRSHSEWNLLSPQHEDGTVDSADSAPTTTLPQSTGKRPAGDGDDDGDAAKSNENAASRSNRKSYFDDHSIYRPKLISSVVTESMNRTLFADRRTKEPEPVEKSHFELSLEKMVVDLVNPAKKRKRAYMNRRLSTVSKRSSISTVSSNSKTLTYRSATK